MTNRREYHHTLLPAVSAGIFCLVLWSCSAMVASETMPGTLTLSAAGRALPVTSGPFQFRATSSVTAQGAVQVDFTVENVSPSTVSYSNGGCQSDVRLYDLKGSRVFSEIALQRTCAPEGLRFTLAPGAQAAFHKLIDTPAILAGVSRGTYALAVTFPNVIPELEMMAGTVMLQ